MIEKVYGRKASKGDGLASVWLGDDGAYAWVQYDYDDGATTVGSGSREFYGSGAEREAERFLREHGFTV